MLTTDGELVTANATENDDLYWALRGGGNFGVVTSLTYQLHPVTTVLAGGLSYPPEQAREALRFYHQFASEAPDEVSMAGSVSHRPDGGPAVSIAVCYSGLLDDGERVLRPLREFGRPMAGAIAPMSYQAFQSGGDASFPLGRQHYWKSSFLKNLTEDAIEVLPELAATCPSPYAGIGLQQMTGADSRVDPQATAVAHRDRQYGCLILSQWDDPADSDRNLDWTRRCFEAMRPHLKDAVYVNNLGDQDHNRVREAYGADYDRLAGVKARYDPDNVFSLNHNIAPRRWV